MPRFLFARDADNDAYLGTVDTLIGIHNTSDNTVELDFAPSQDAAVRTAGEIDKVVLTVAAATEKATIKEITEAIAHSKEAMLVLYDGVDSVGVSSNISAVATTLANAN